MKRLPVYMLALMMLLAGCGSESTPMPESSETSGDVSAETAVSVSETASAASETFTVQDTAVTTSATEITTYGSFEEETDTISQTDELLEYSRDVIRDNGCIVGIAFVGYIDSELPEADIRKFLESSKTFNIYSYLDKANLVCQVGSELYALTPLEGYSITVYPTEVNEDGENIADRSAPLYCGKSGESIVLRCNLSEIYSNALISVTNGSETVEFWPMLSMMDGHMITPDKCHDLSIYQTAWDELVNEAYENLLSTFEIKDHVDMGMTLRCTDEITELGNGMEGLVFALGTDHEDQFVNEKFYAYDIENGYKFYLDPMTGEWEILAEG